MSYYIKGNKERGDEVIALLESKGGKNTHGLSGESIGSYYFIDKNNAIVSYPSEDCFELLGFFGEELTLPEEWEPKFKLGNKVKFHPNGTILGTITGVDFANKSYTVHTSDCDYHRNEDNIILDEWKPKFKVGDYVRDYYTSIGQIDSISDDGRYHIKYIDTKVAIWINEDKFTLWEPQRGETVLVTESYTNYWEEAVFSFKTNGSYHMAGGSTWTFCIPFDINKLGKVKD